MSYSNFRDAKGACSPEVKKKKNNICLPTESRVNQIKLKYIY